MPKTYFAAPELAALLDGSSAGELIPELARHGLQQLIELEVAAFLGADRHERTEERLGYRNGYRTRTLTTQVGDLDLLIPKLRTGSFLPSILEHRHRVDQALYAVIMEAYIHGVSTRKVDALVSALGSQSGISKSQVSRICQEIDAQVQAFLSRPLESSGYAYLYLDATYLHGRLGKSLQVCSRAVVVAMGVNADGRRELLGIKVGDSETEAFWAQFISHLKERGLSDVKLVVNDAHVGLTKAIGRQLQGCVWQRCRVHFARNLLPRVPKAHQGMVTAALRSVFAQETAADIPTAGMIWPPRWPNASPMPPRSWTKPGKTCWPSATSLKPTGARSGAPTCWSGSTRRSNGAPVSSASSPTTRRSPAWWVRCCCRAAQKFPQASPASTATSPKASIPRMS
jgi:putative transposase